MLINLLVDNKSDFIHKYNVKKRKKAENTENSIFAYKDRNFATEHIININNKNLLKQYQHIKQKQQNYLVFDIDYINKSKAMLLFYNDFFTPNFYIYEYSKNKKCYTLQVFILLDKKFILNDNFTRCCVISGVCNKICYLNKRILHYYEKINSI